MKISLKSTYVKYSALAAIFVAGLFCSVLIANAVTTTCSSSLSSPGTYTLAADTTNTCNITSAGVTLDGAGHTIGNPPPTPFPNNGATSGGLNMTGNVLLYHMNESSGTIIDTSGAGHNSGSVNGSVTYSASGDIGSALSFNNGYILVPDSQLPLGNSARSVSLWFKPDGVSGYHGLFGMGPNSSDAFYSLLLNDQVCIGHWGGGDNCSGAGTVVAGTWQHLVITYDGTDARIYLNGVLKNTGLNRGYNTTSNGNLVIGYDLLPYDAFYGSIDEFAMWSRALSPSEVATIYSAQSSSGAGTAVTVSNGLTVSITNLITGRSILAPAGTMNIANSTVATVDVSGADAAGNGQDGGTVTLTNTTAGALIANGGNSTDSGLGGAAGSFSLLSGSTATSQTANIGHCGPNNITCVNIFNNDGGDGDWDNSANWSKGFVPGSSDNVEIQANVASVSSGNASVNTAHFSSGAVWDPNYNYLQLNVADTVTFSDTSYFNYGEIHGNAAFNGSSFMNAGYIYGNATFADSAFSNAWGIYGDAVFSSAAYDNSYISGNATFNDSAYLDCGSVQGNAVFNGASYATTCGASVSGSTTINSTGFTGSLPTNGSVVMNGGSWGLTMYGYVYGSDSQQITSFEFDSGAYNYAELDLVDVLFDGSIDYGYIGQNATFNNGSINYGSVNGSGTFDNASDNEGGQVSGDATFTNASYNNGTVYGNVTFNDTSYNNGSLYGSDTIFNGDSSEYNPGYAANVPIRYYSSPTVTSRDFTANGGSWIVTADGVVVDLSGATCSADTTFNPINGGSFIYGPNCAAGPAGVSIIRPAASSFVGLWSPLVNWNQGVGGYNYSSCQYSFGSSADWDGTSDWDISSPEYGTWQGASCTGNGADITAPASRGTQMMAIRAFYQGVATSSTHTFTYAPSRLMYFYNNGSNPSWASAGNWYTNSSHTTPAGSVPTSVDKVTITGTTTPTVDLDTWVQPALINSGTVGVSFTSAASASTTVQINGNAIFNGSAISSSTVSGNATFNNSSINRATIKTNATFNATSDNIGRVSGNATFNGNLSTTTGTIVGIKTRYYTATTTTTLNFVGWTVVADGVVVDATDATHDATTLFRTIRGGSFIGGPATVYFWSNGSDARWATASNWFSDAATTTALGRVPLTTETVTTLGTTTPLIDLSAPSWRTPSGIDATLTGIILTSTSTSHINTGITGSTTFSGAAINDGIIAGDTTFRNTARNSATGIISGNAVFNDTTVNNGGAILGDATFNTSSYNTNNGSITGDAVFNNSSYNDTTAGSISGTATFNGTSHNDGTIVNDAFFSGNVPENNGTVQGTQTRYYTATTTTIRDFVTTGPWTVVADGVRVTLGASSTFSTTTTFTTVNGGSFVGEGLPGTTTCTKPLIFAGTYTLGADTANTCSVSAPGVTINGAGHAISLGGWFDVTGNIFLEHMEDTSSSVADTSGYGNLGTIHGGVTTGASGVLGNALSFDGSGYVSVPTSASLVSPQNTRKLSATVWINPANFTSEFPTIFSKGYYNTSGGYALMLNRNGDNDLLFGSNSNQCVFWTSGANGSLINSHLNTWIFVAITVDAATEDFRVYVNGVQYNNVVNGNPGVCASQGNFSGSADLNIGMSAQLDRSFNGKIDELALWNRVLSPTEIADIYTQQHPGAVTPLALPDNGATAAAVVGHGNSFTVSNLITTLSIASAGGTITIANSTISSVDVSGANAAGDGQAGGAIHLTSTTAGALIANGGNSTDYGLGGAAGTITLASGSTATSQTANAGSDGPNSGAGQQHSTTNGGSSSSVAGCTDPGSSNYNSNATVDNGSCRYQSSQVRGCTDPSATNYNPSATINASCSYPHYTAYVPPASGGNSQSTTNTAAPSSPAFNSGGNLLSLAQLRALGLTNLPQFSLNLGTSTGLGVTNFGNVLAGLQSPGALNVKSTPKFSLTSYVSNFLFEPLATSTRAIFKNAPKLLTLVNSSGIFTAQDFINAKKKPVVVKTPDVVPAGLYVVRSGGSALKTYLTSTGTSTIQELVYVEAKAPFTVSLVPVTTGKVDAVFAGKKVTFTSAKSGAAATLDITASSTLGRYTLTTAASPMPLVVEVVAPVKHSPLNVPSVSNLKTAVYGLGSWIKSVFTSH